MIKSITRLYLMTQALTNIYRHLQLLVGNLISFDTSIPNLKQRITWNIP